MTDTDDDETVGDDQRPGTLDVAAIVPAVRDLPPDVQPWEQQPRETKKAYGAFRVYCELGSRARSVRQTAENLNVSDRTVADWSRKHAWVARAKAWDRKIAAEADARLVEQRVEALERHAKVAKVFIGKIVQRLESLKPEELSPRDLVRWLDVATRVERLSLGIPNTLELSGPGGGPIPVEKMTTEERRARLAERLDALASHAAAAPPSDAG